jgi:gluconokinase
VAHASTDRRADLTADRRGPIVLALDVGTSSVRARFYDTAGRALYAGPIAVRRYAWSLDGGGMTRPADDLLADTFAVLDAAEARAADEDLDVVAVAIAGFWHGLLGLDAAGDPVTPLFSWADQRGSAEAARLSGEVDEAAVHRRTGCFFHPSYPSVRLLWLRSTAPEVFGRAAAWVSFPEYLEARLFGERRCSFSMASGTGLLDIHRLEWDGEWLELTGVRAPALSPLVDAGAPLRGMRPEHTRRWPRISTAEWHPALGDGGCANIGSGAIGRARPGLTIGTSAAVRAVWSAESVEVPPELWCYRVDSRRWVVGRALSNGGNGIARLGRLLDSGSASGALAIDEAASVPADSHGLTVLPYLLTERVPGWETGLDGAIVGMTEATTPAHLMRAWMEAVTYRLREAAVALERSAGPAECVVASGGAIHGSPVWAGIVADVLSRPVVLPDDRETTSRGAALLTLEALGLMSDIAGAAPPQAARYDPDPERHARYAAAADRQGRLERALRRWRDDP